MPPLCRLAAAGNPVWGVWCSSWSQAASYCRRFLRSSPMQIHVFSVRCNSGFLPGRHHLRWKPEEVPVKPHVIVSCCPRPLAIASFFTKAVQGAHSSARCCARPHASFFNFLSRAPGPPTIPHSSPASALRSIPVIQCSRLQVHLLLIDSLHVRSTSRNEMSQMAAQAQCHSFPTPPTNLPCYLTRTYPQTACIFGSFVFSQFEKCNMEPRQQLTAGCAARAPSVRGLALQCWFGTGQPTCSGTGTRSKTHQAKQAGGTAGNIHRASQRVHANIRRAKPGAHSNDAQQLASNTKGAFVLLSGFICLASSFAILHPASQPLQNGDAQPDGTTAAHSPKG